MSVKLPKIEKFIEERVRKDGSRIFIPYVKMLGDTWYLKEEETIFGNTYYILYPRDTYLTFDSMEKSSRALNDAFIRWTNSYIDNENRKTTKVITHKL